MPISRRQIECIARCEAALKSSRMRLHKQWEVARQLLVRGLDIHARCIRQHVASIVRIEPLRHALRVEAYIFEAYHLRSDKAFVADKNIRMFMKMYFSLQHSDEYSSSYKQKKF